MQRALKEAKQALLHSDVPIGAICVYEGQIISQRHNETTLRMDPTAHAEFLAMADARRSLGSRYLNDVTIYSTLEPCCTCAGAMVLNRVNKLVFATADPKAGAAGSLYNLCCDPRLNHEVTVASGPLADESAKLLTNFFALRRKGN